MDAIVKVVQIVIALGVANVWLFRAEKATPFRGGDATTIREEWVVYGLPEWSLAAVKFSKLALAACLVLGLFVPVLTLVGAFGMAAFMVGAVAMHVKVRDPLMKSMPAAVLLVLSLYVGMAAL
jgi:hypothetical protein